jgi:hypothetical protein
MAAMQMRRALAVLALGSALHLPASPTLSQAAGQQQADPSFRVVVTRPMHAPGRGPRVCFDHGHHNFHRLDGRFAPFGDLLQADGYRVEPVEGSFVAGTLRHCRVLVIANAQPGNQPWSEYPYPTPSAFEPAEVLEVERWVRQGGRLLLIADHMPLAGAAASLAAAFDVEFNDGFAVEDFRTEAEGHAAFRRPTRFSLDAGTLRPHPATRGRRSEDAVDHVYTFVGQALRAGPTAHPLLVLPDNFVSLMPRVAWEFTLETPRKPAGGWLQGATLEYGRGRVAVFGEAAMFTAQISADGRTMGMNAPEADQNARFARNLLGWLTRD